jgi:hypothetical protein
MKKIYYEKIGRRYVPVSEYDSDFLDSFSKGNHLVMSYPGGTSRRYNVDPAYVPMIAAGRVAEDAVCDVIRKASELKPVRRAMTQAEIDAWENLIAVWGDEVRTLQGSSARDIAEAAVVAMMTEADKLLQNPSVRLAYEKFLTVAELAKEIRN